MENQIGLSRFWKRSWKGGLLGSPVLAGAFILILLLLHGITFDSTIFLLQVLGRTLVVCSLLFVFSDGIRLAVWPRTLAVFVLTIEFARWISCRLGLREHPCHPSDFDEVNWIDDCTVSFLISIVVAGTAVGVIRAILRRIRFRYCHQSLLKCILSSALILGILGLSRTHLWIEHNLAHGLVVLREGLLPLILFEIVRDILITSLMLEALFIGKTELRSYRFIGVLFGLLIVVEVADYYYLDRLIKRLYVNSLVEGDWSGTYERIIFRSTETLLVLFYCLVFRIALVQERPMNDVDLRD